MGLETATYIPQLVSSNPVHTDGLNNSDAHARLIKEVLQSSFPNFVAAALASSNTAIDAVTAALTTAGAINQGAYLLPGDAVASASSAARPGCLYADGTSYATSAYPALFDAISYTWGGSGSNFNVPDWRGRVLAGDDSATGRLNGSLFTNNSAIGTTAGEATHALVTAELASHTHGITDGGHAHTVSDPEHNHGYADPTHTHEVAVAYDSDGAGASPGAWTGADSTTSAASVGITIHNASTGITINSHTTGVTVNSAGSGTAHNNVQPTSLVFWWIKT